jgi:hypothetical protein
MLREDGFCATYRRAGHGRSDQTIPVDGGPFASLGEAERACRRTWHAVKNCS